MARVFPFDHHQTLKESRVGSIGEGSRQSCESLRGTAAFANHASRSNISDFRPRSLCSTTWFDPYPKVGRRVRSVALLGRAQSPSPAFRRSVSSLWSASTPACQSPAPATVLVDERVVQCQSITSCERRTPLSACSQCSSSLAQNCRDVRGLYQVCSQALQTRRLHLRPGQRRTA